MNIEPTSIEGIVSLRKLYRMEMSCQIVHDSLHRRENWAQSYLLKSDLAVIGYGSILDKGPWIGTRTVFEFYAIPEQRMQIFRHFEAFLNETKATAISTQTNDPILTPLFLSYSKNIASEKILFDNCIDDFREVNGLVFRPIKDSDLITIFEHKHEPIGAWLLEYEGEVVGTGGIMTHYNPPYADLYMEISEEHRRKGYGAFLVQALKSECYKSDLIPCCRCTPTNEASIKTIQRAGFQPCAHILTGTIKTAKN